jgi:hypothetical protein
MGIGDYDRGVSELESLFSEQLAAGEAMEEPGPAVYLAEALLVVGRPEEALDRLAALEEKAPRAAQRVRAGAARVRARVLAAKAETAAADGLLRQALGFAVEAGDRFEEALIRESLAELERRVGKDPDPANQEQLSKLFELLGIARHSEAVIGN